MKKAKLLLSSLCLLGIFLFSCTEDYFEFDKIKTDEWRPELAIPLVNTSLTLENVILAKDTLGIIHTNPNTGVLQVEYDGEVETQLGNAVVQIPNHNFNETINGIVVPPIDSIQLTQNIGTTMNLGGTVEIDSTILKQGSLAMTFSSDFQHRIKVRATYHGFKDPQGNTLIQNFNIPPSDGNTPTVRSVITDLTNYHIDFTENGTTVNSIPIEMQLTVIRVPGNPSSPTDELRLNGSFSNADFSDFYGYVGQLDQDLEKDTILINVFRNFKNGSFFLTDPILDINITSSYGLPAELRFDELKSRNPDNNPIEIDFNLPQNPIPLGNNSGPGVSTTNIELNNSTSNIAPIVSSLLKEIAYDAKVVMNPNGATSRNYIADTSGIKLHVNLELPFSGYASGFNLADTIDFNFENTDDIENGLIRVRSENGFPIEAKMQIVFVDEFYSPLDSLYPNGKEVVIPPSITNNAGRTIQNSFSTLDQDIGQERLAKLKTAKFALIQAELATPNAPTDTTSFYPEYKLKMAVGLKAKIKIQ